MYETCMSVFGDIVSSFQGGDMDTTDHALVIDTHLLGREREVFDILDDEARLARMLFEERLLATGLVRAAKVGFVCLNGIRAGVRVLLLPVGEWSMFGGEEAHGRREAVVSAVVEALACIFDRCGHCGQFMPIDIDKERVYTQLALAGSLPSLLVGEARERCVAVVGPPRCGFGGEGQPFGGDEDKRLWAAHTLAGCHLAPLREEGSRELWKDLVRVAASGYDRDGPLSPFLFAREKEIRDACDDLDGALTAAKMEPPGEEAHAVVFTVTLAMRGRPFAPIKYRRGYDHAKAFFVEERLVETGFFETASFFSQSALYFFESIVFRAVVRARDATAAGEAPFVFFRELEDIFREANNSRVLDVAIGNPEFTGPFVVPLADVGLLPVEVMDVCGPIGRYFAPWDKFLRVTLFVDERYCLPKTEGDSEFVRHLTLSPLIASAWVDYCWRDRVWEMHVRAKLADGVSWDDLRLEKDAIVCLLREALFSSFSIGDEATEGQLACVAVGLSHAPASFWPCRFSTMEEEDMEEREEEEE